MARKRSDNIKFRGAKGITNLFSRTAKSVVNFVKNLKIKPRAKKATAFASKTIERKPFTVFFGILGIMLLLIIIGSIIRRPKPEAKTVLPVKSVSTYKIGTAPKIQVQAKVEKSGVIKVVALTPGVVNQINVVEGQTVTAGTTLIGIASSYSGGNTASLQRQLAALQYQNAKDTYDTQKGAIDNQRALAQQNKDNAEKMREITDQGINDTQGLIDLDSNIISTLQSTLQNLENTNVGGANDAQILATKEQLSQFQAGVNQLNAGQRQARYAADSANPPTQLANTSYDLATKQLDLQQKALDLSLESSRIGLSIATVAESMMFPSAPFSGTIERIYVTEGQNVNPGTPLVLIHGDQTSKVVAKVSSDTAKKVSSIEESILHMPGGQTVKMAPTYVSNEATDGSLYSVIYNLEDQYQNDLTNLQYVTVDIPVGHADTTATAPFIPLDSVYQSQNSSYIFVIDNGKAKSKSVKLGEVFGQYVQVENGLSSGDEVILSRNVINGDLVRSN
ncbi:MAG TPA: HlyD family efflux transporter periplasmic adaptor subunit [Patescibacteria group bacterium]|nr:HlyD family efflux transporter periplasmic adaptor subunit [Patescibacteria group bacterium]